MDLMQTVCGVELL